MWKSISEWKQSQNLTSTEMNRDGLGVLSEIPDCGCGCYDCNNAVYLGSGDYACWAHEEPFMVIEDGLPRTDTFMECSGEHYSHEIE